MFRQICAVALLGICVGLHADFGPKYMTYELCEFPWPHGFSESLVPEEYARKMSEDFPEWDSPIWEEHGRIFDTPYGYKKMLEKQSVMPASISKLVDELKSPKFISELCEATGIPELIFDDKLYGGGLFIHPPGGFLAPHVDFNFNNDIKLYRAVNFLFYMSEDLEGGEFELYDTDVVKQKRISPKLNSSVFFVTNNTTYHGVGEIQKGFRKLLSVWYYSREPLEDVSIRPHRTIWVENN